MKASEGLGTWVRESGIRVLASGLKNRIQGLRV